MKGVPLLHDGGGRDVIAAVNLYPLQGLYGVCSVLLI